MVGGLGVSGPWRKDSRDGADTRLKLTRETGTDVVGEGEVRKLLVSHQGRIRDGRVRGKLTWVKARFWPQNHKLRAARGHLTVEDSLGEAQRRPVQVRWPLSLPTVPWKCPIQATSSH